MKIQINLRSPIYQLKDHVHRSMRASNIIEAVEKIAVEKKKKEEKKQAHVLKKEEAKETFYQCKQKCACEKRDGKCSAIDLKECSNYHSILKSQCRKQLCSNATGEKHSMLLVDVIKKKVYRKSIQSDDKLTFEEENIINDDVSRNIETSSHDDSEY